MKFNKNNSKKSFTLLGFLSFCAIALSVETTGFKQLTRNEDISSTSTTAQEHKNQEQQKTFDLPNTANEETWEKVELNKEWENILGDDESEGEMLVASTRAL